MAICSLGLWVCEELRQTETHHQVKDAINVLGVTLKVIKFELFSWDHFKILNLDHLYIYIRAVNRLKYVIAINRTFLFVLNVP